MSREAARDPRLLWVWVSVLVALGGCSRPVRVGAATTVVLTAGIALPLSTDCTDCDARDYATITALSFAGSALVGTLVGYVLHDAGPESKPRPSPPTTASSDDDVARGPGWPTHADADPANPALPNLPSGATANQACAAAKQEAIEHIDAECERVAVGIAAASGITDPCDCTQTDDGFVCTAPTEPTCARDIDVKIGLGAASAAYESNARDRATGAARAICGRYAHGAKVRDTACTCDQTDCVCTVVATCDP